MVNISELPDQANLAAGPGAHLRTGMEGIGSSRTQPAAGLALAKFQANTGEAGPTPYQT